MGFLSSLVRGGLDLMHVYDPINSALLNWMIDVDTTGVRETMKFSEHFWDDLENKYAPGFLQGIAGGLKNNSQHWAEMAQKDHDNHARAITNAGLTLAALYGANSGGWFGAGDTATAGGSATNSVLADSAAGSAGYGTSSAAAGGAG